MTSEVERSRRPIQGERLGANPARSLDGKFLFVYGFGSTGFELLLYSTAVKGYLTVSAQVPNGSGILGRERGRLESSPSLITDGT